MATIASHKHNLVGCLYLQTRNLYFQKLFGFLLEYFGDISLRVPVPMPLLDKLTVHLYELAQQFPKLTAEHSRHVIQERQKLFTVYSQSKNGRGVWPFLDLVRFSTLSYPNGVWGFH